MVCATNSCEWSQKILRLIRPSEEWFSCDSHHPLQKEMEAMSAESLHRALQEVVREEKSLQAIDHFVEWIPLEKLQDAVRGASLAQGDALQTARAMVKEAKYYFSQQIPSISPTLQTRISSVVDALLSVLESLISAFGIADFFKPAENDFHAEFKGQKIMMLCSFFSMLTTMLLPVLAPGGASLLIGGILLSIAALSLIYPLINRKPLFLPATKNWTQECREGKLSIAEGRKGVLDDIAKALIASKEVKTHVMLLGKTGIGKTETVKAFVHAIERGDYPELKGKEVFYINTADIVSSKDMFGAGNRILSRISEAMGRHRNEIILVFDEIHMACQKRDQSMIGDQLKTLLDNGQDNFPYVIGMTTEEEYYREIYRNNPAFARRFKRIAIENTEEVETKEILNASLLRRASKVLLEPGIVQVLLQKVEATFGREAAEPATALKILSQCIEKTTESQKSPLEQRIEQLRLRIRSYTAQGAVEMGMAHEREEQDLEEQLKECEQRLRQEKEAIEKLYQARDTLFEAKQKIFRSVIKMSQVAQSAFLQKELSRFLLLHHYLAPALEAHVRSEAHRLGVKTVIDAALIDEVIDEEIENNRRAEEEVERGRVQIAVRERRDA